VELQSAILLLLVNVGLVAKIAILGRCVFTRLWRGRVLFCAMVTLSSFVSALGVTGSLHPYYEVWQVTLMPLAILEFAAAVEAYWILAFHFRNIRRFGMILITIITAVSAAAAAVVFVLRNNWNEPLSRPILISQYAELFLVMVTLLSFGFFRQFPRVPIRPNAVRHLLVLSTLALFFFMGRLIVFASGGEAKFISQLVVAAGAVLTYSTWLVIMKPKGEDLPFAPEPPMPVEEFDAAEAEESEANRELKRASSEALRKLREP
jgi:hypothetical protein